MISRDEYCREVSAFLDPSVVLQSLQAFESDSDAALAPDGVYLTSDILRSGNEGELASLLRLYCEHFQVPESLLGLCRTFGASEETVKWLRDLRVEATIEVDPDGPAPPGDRYIILIRERNVVADMLMQPSLMLLDLVERFVETWRPMRDLAGGPPRVYMQHSSNGPFAVFVEATVTRSFGFTDAAMRGRDDYGGPKLNYRSTTLAGAPLPPDPRLHAVARDSAQHNIV